MIIIANATKEMLSPPSDTPIPTPRVIVENLVRRYRDLHHAHLKTNTAIGYNTVYVAFKMQALIDKLTLMLEDSDECRIYFGAHDTDAPMGEDGEYNYRNKMTLVFVGAKTGDDGCITEQLDNSTKFAYDFGTLCPPQCDSCCESDNSISTRIFGTGPCDHPPA